MPNVECLETQSNHEGPYVDLHGTSARVGEGLRPVEEDAHTQPLDPKFLRIRSLRIAPATARAFFAGSGG